MSPRGSEPERGWFAGLVNRRRPPGIHAALADRQRYERQIDRLHQRHLFDGGLHRLADGEVTLGSVVMQRSQVARLLARTVERGAYALRPATLRSIRVDGKPRTVFEYPVLDLIVHGVVAEILEEAVEPQLVANLYSYRSGISWWAGVSAFARFVRRHRRARPDPRTRGLYVLRRDVNAYTDSVPLGAGSAIWAQLDEVLARIAGPGATPDDRKLIEEVVRPTIVTSDGALAVRLRGVATGQPISCLCFNLYLGDLDRDLDAIPGGFYARYSDDLLFAHPDPDVCREVSEQMDRRIATLDLRFNLAKGHDLYLTGAGRASDAWSDVTGTTSVPFLGMRVTMDGTVALGHRKVRGLLRDARRRALNTARSMHGADDDARGRAVAAVLNRLLDADDADLQGAAAPLLARAITDRRQLDALDHELARIVAWSVSGIPGPAAFRRVPYHRARESWGLRSVRRARDRSVFGDTARAGSANHAGTR